MHVDYKISEKDYLDGQRLAIKNSSVRMVRWTRFDLPSFGALLAVFLIHAIWTQGFSVSVLPGMCSSPIRCARHEKDFFLFGASSSVWDCRLIRRPAKDACRKREACLGRVTRKGVWSSQNSSCVYAATA